MVLKKKGAIYSVIALMLCVAVYLNWSYTKNDGDFSAASNNDGKVLGEATLVNKDTDKNGNDASKTDDKTTGTDGKTDGSDSTTTNATGSDYFAQARLSRQKARDEAVSILNVTIENANATEDAKKEANESIKSLSDCAVREARIENVILAKGYQECVVFINDSGVNVIVAKTEKGLQDSDVAKIKEIVLNEADVKAENIKIIETT